MLKPLPLLLASILVATSAAAQPYSNDQQQEPQQQGPSTTERVLKGAAGAGIGGLVGSQIGGGRGNTAITAAGAATGAVVGSGCKPGVGTAIGAVAGALLGSQLANSRTGKNVGAGIGSAAGAILGSDCSAEAAAAPQPQPPRQQVRLRPVRINGMNAYLGGTYNLGPYNSLPPVRTMADVRALNDAIRQMNALTMTNLKRGDYDAALVSNHLAARLTEYQMFISGSTRSAIEAMAGNVSGSSMIAPGSYAVLPIFNRGGARPVRLAMSEEPNPFVTVRLEDGVKVAASGLEGLLGVLSGGGRNQQQQRQGAMEAIESLGSMPIGTPVTLPSGIVVERTVDSFVVHNPGNATASVSLGELGYLPPIKEPSANRKTAGTVMTQAMESAHVVFERTMNIRSEGVWPRGPNNITVDGQSVATLDTTGAITSDPKKAAAAAKEYNRPHSPFRLSMDAIAEVLDSGERQQFQSQCIGTGQMHTFGVDFTGQYAEIVVFWCGRGRTARSHDVYERQFYLNENGMIQTWSSLVRDVRTVELLKTYDQTAEAVENVVQIIPVVGSVESGIKCAAPGNSLTRAAAAGASSVYEFVTSADSEIGPLRRSRDFVSTIYNPYEAVPMDLGRAMDCAAALPAVGKAAQLAGRVGVRLDAHLAEHGQRIYDALKAFDTALLTGEPSAQLASRIGTLGGGRQAANFIAKTYYDAAQTAKTFADFYSSLAKLS